MKAICISSVFILLLYIYSDEENIYVYCMTFSEEKQKHINIER